MTDPEIAEIMKYFMYPPLPSFESHVKTFDEKIRHNLDTIGFWQNPTWWDYIRDGVILFITRISSRWAKLLVRFTVKPPVYAAIFTAYRDEAAAIIAEMRRYSYMDHYIAVILVQFTRQVFSIEKCRPTLELIDDWMDQLHSEKIEVVNPFRADS